MAPYSVGPVYRVNQDTAANLYDFPARDYGIQGRWPSPDPAGLASVSPDDPQTWNHYAYVRNSPLGATDPTGESCICAEMEDLNCPDGFGGGWSVGAYVGLAPGGGGVYFGNNEFDALAAAAEQTANMDPTKIPQYQPQGVFSVGANGWSWSPDSPTAFEFTGTKYGKQYNDYFNTWADYSSWSTDLAAQPSSQCYQSAMVIMKIQGSTSVSGSCTESTAGLVYSFQMSKGSTDKVNRVTVKADGGWPDPITSYHNGADSWYFGVFADTPHLVDFTVDQNGNSVPINAHVDPFGPFNPLHYLIQLPLGKVGGANWNGTCSAVGGCSF